MLSWLSPLLGSNRTPGAHKGQSAHHDYQKQNQRKFNWPGHRIAFLQMRVISCLSTAQNTIRSIYRMSSNVALQDAWSTVPIPVRRTMPPKAFLAPKSTRIWCFPAETGLIRVS